MQIIVPLAGPDFEAGPTVKAEVDVDGMPLLRRALESRAWWRNGAEDDLVFVLRDTDGSRAFAATRLAGWYPEAKKVFLSQTAQGAALSVLAGLALAAHRNGPVIIDLADILFDCSVDPTLLFSGSAPPGAVALVFESSKEIYSYLRFDASGVFEEAAEKRVISNNASAGTYLFRSPALLLRAIAHSLENAATVTHRGLFFVCPLFNGVRAAAEPVQMSFVTNVRDVKLV